MKTVRKRKKNLCKGKRYKAKEGGKEKVRKEANKKYEIKERKAKTYNNTKAIKQKIFKIEQKHKTFFFLSKPSEVCLGIAHCFIC